MPAIDVAGALVGRRVPVGVVAAWGKGRDKIKFAPRLKLDPPISLRQIVRQKVKRQ